MRGAWSFSTQEAVANIRSAKLQALVQFALALAVGAAVVVLSAMNSRAIIHERTKQEDAGRSTYVVTAVSAPLSAALCDAAGGIDGVRGAGAILQRYLAKTSLGTTSNVEILRVTPGYVPAAWGEVAPATWSVVAPVDLARELGLTRGSTFTTATSSEKGTVASRVTVDWSPTKRSRVAGINDSIIEAAPPTGAASECLVTARPNQRDSVRQALAGWFGKGYRVAPFLQPSALVADPDVAFSERPSQWIAVVGPFFVVGARVVFLFARRADLALYRAMGMSTRELARMILTEFLLTVLIPFQVGASIGLLTAIGLQTEGVTAVANDYIRALAVLAIGAAATLLLPSRRSTFDQVRGR